MSVLKKFVYAGGGVALGYLAWKAFANSSEMGRSQGRAKRKNVLIVGAGFAGLAVASELARLLPDVVLRVQRAVNSSLTIIANALRVGDHLLERLH